MNRFLHINLEVNMQTLPNSSAYSERLIEYNGIVAKETISRAIVQSAAGYPTLWQYRTICDCYRPICYHFDFYGSRTILIATDVARKKS